jgi:diguanylate cyclase (GGDEF)-like protein
MASRFGPKIANEILAGSVFVEAGEGTLPENPAYFAEAYLPIRSQRALLGFIEVYVDQTAKASLYQETFLAVAIMVALLVLVAGGVPMSMVYYKMRDHRKAEAVAKFLARHDHLTGLANRKELSDAGRLALGAAQKANGNVALLALKLDRFKLINDNYGHLIGDKLLCAVAARLNSAIRPDDLVARDVGHKFMILQTGLPQPQGAVDLARTLARQFAAPFEIEGHDLTCGILIGIAMTPRDTINWETLVSFASAALSCSKPDFDRNICIFEAEMEAALRHRQRLERDLRRGVAEQAFNVHYQPVYDFHSGALVGFEALLRWPQAWPPESPVDFIPLAEDSGLIVPLGAFVLQTACETAAGWERPLKIAVNLSPIQFRNGDLVETVSKILATSGLPASRLELEVTEGLLLQATDKNLDQLKKLRGLGITIVLDDFGTGHSSLTYLWQFPFDKVKIDRSFVFRMKQDPKAAAIIDTIVGLGRTLNLVVTAEGVETKAQLEALKKTGCDQAQGYLLGRPQTVEVANRLVNRGETFQQSVT